MSTTKRRYEVIVDGYAKVWTSQRVEAENEDEAFRLAVEVAKAGPDDAWEFYDEGLRYGEVEDIEGLDAYDLGPVVEEVS
jgi:hypothetical protein